MTRRVRRSDGGARAEGVSGAFHVGIHGSDEVALVPGEQLLLHVMGSVGAEG